MIKLTLIKGEPIIINVDQILMIEKLGDTILTCANGNKIRVKESAMEVVELTMRWHQKKWIPIIDK
tara:strand:+ start:71 stop:268 length:198 start_codon:yes stop_codon:yes gene_type:complete